MFENSLGQEVEYPQTYNSDLLVAIPRAENREHLGIEETALPFQGADIFNAYEISWLDNKGKPQVGIGRFTFYCDAPNIVESKSLKLYLNSFNNEKIETLSLIERIIAKDLSAICEQKTSFELLPIEPKATVLAAPDGICLDGLDLSINHYQPDNSILSLEGDEQGFDQIVDEVLYTNLFKSNCPITNQPDWATITICYRGKKISRKSLLGYLISYRQYNDYHENCVEAIFQALMAQCQPQALTVEANFLRRGGIDINPIRTTETGLDYQNFPRFIRQ